MDRLEESVRLMGLTFLCNRLVEGMFYFKQNQKVSQKLKQSCEEAIAEFNSLKWPRPEASLPLYDSIFGSNYMIDVLDNFFSSYYKNKNQTNLSFVDNLISDLKYVLSDDLLEKRLETAQKLQVLFDSFGDYCCFYKNRELFRG